MEKEGPLLEGLALQHKQDSGCEWPSLEVIPRVGKATQHGDPGFLRESLGGGGGVVPSQGHGQHLEIVLQFWLPRRQDVTGLWCPGMSSDTLKCAGPLPTAKSDLLQDVHCAKVEKPRVRLSLETAAEMDFFDIQFVFY